jgi:membrane-associated protease RseP (regulator of RpoE activity)
LASDTRSTPKRERAPAARGACSGVEVRLITESDDPTWAFASLSPAAGERAVIRRVGERIGDMRVVKIEWDRVWLAGGGGRCAASMHFGAREAGEADDSRPSKRGRGLPDERRAEKPWRLSGEMVNGIEKLGETDFAVDRGLLPAIYAQAGSLLAGLKIEPVRRDEEVVGFELGEVRVDSLLERLGVETGDRVLAIDETPARDLDALVRALGAAREKERLVAHLERQGEAFALKVTVR